MSCYSNIVRNKTLKIYDSIIANPETHELHKIDHIFVNELRREPKPYYTLIK